MLQETFLFLVTAKNRSLKKEISFSGQIITPSLDALKKTVRFEKQFLSNTSS
jgi:hypothetical protein